MVRDGTSVVADQITPKANSVSGAVPALIKVSAVFTGANSGNPDRLNIIAKIIVSKTGFLPRRFKDTVIEADLCANTSVEITKKAKVIAASHATIVTIGILPTSP